MRLNRSIICTIAVLGALGAAALGYHAYDQRQQARVKAERSRSLATAEALAAAGKDKDALAVYDRLVESLSAGKAPALFRLVQRRRAEIHLNLSKGNDRAEHLGAAIDALTAALGPSEDGPEPDAVAAMYRQLAEAHRQLGMLQWPRRHLPESIRFYRLALPRYKSDDPEAYASICKGMALAHRQLAEYEAPEENLRSAMDGFRCALTVYTLQTHPFEFAVAHNNLGAVEMTLAGGDDRERRLAAAVDHFLSATKGFSPARDRLDAAFAYNNLGLAYTGLAEFADREKRLSQALRAFEAARALLPPGGQMKLAAVIEKNRIQVEKALQDPTLSSGDDAVPSQQKP
ncbi:MAG: hypothetical protein PVG78_13785 [Desulfobacterales bacterium]